MFQTLYVSRDGQESGIGEAVESLLNTLHREDGAAPTCVTVIPTTLIPVMGLGCTRYEVTRAAVVLVRNYDASAATRRRV